MNFNSLVKSLFLTLLLMGVSYAQLDVGNGVVLDLGYKTTNDGRLRVTAYMPQSNTPTPLVVYIHGGGWQVGDRDEVERNGDVRSVAQGLIDRGIAVASVQYRFAADGNNRMRDGIADVKDAIRFMNRHSDIYNIDPDNIATFGISAGAHMAMVTALSPPTLSQFVDDASLSGFSDFTVRGCVSWYGPATFRTEHWDVWDNSSFSQRVLDSLINNGTVSTFQRLLVSPYTYMDSNSPPLAMYHGTNDGIIPDEGSFIMALRALEVGNPDFEFTSIAGAGHNLGNRAQQTIAETIDRLSGYLGVSAASSSGNFVPDPNQEYHIDVAGQTNSRVSARSGSQDAYAQASSRSGVNTRWKFVRRNDGYYHIDRAAGGSTPRLRTDNTLFADMQATSSSGTFTYYEITPSKTVNGAYYLTLPNGPSGRQRLRVFNGHVVFNSVANEGNQVSFFITEAN